MTRHTESWPADRVESLEKLWKSGLSASQIGERLGCTRSAVIGRLYRMGLRDANRTSQLHRPPVARTRRPRSAAPSSKRPARQSQTTHHQSASQRPYVEPDEDVVVPVGERKRLIDLGDADCRWPIGDPQHADFHFCNRSKMPGMSYCEAHAQRAYLPATAQRHVDARTDVHAGVHEAPVPETMCRRDLVGA